MAHAPRSALSLLNTDGRAHPRENALAFVTIALGLVAAVSGFFTGLHALASWAGLIGVLVGGWGQMVSATTGERFLLVIGMGGAGFGLYMGIVNGGFLG
ncbi:hypothetical protein GCM10027160_03150 [Streptomyces calidiresistens]|uniref:Integral membrane protein n=1 Tax=Streptomyces calidiresistens TaxID=1485586 RepID=A0A7W3T0H3_9ACTN|nr:MULTISPECIES: hypothetical protein [Streptomyces]MBB0228645.1 hypothetical protein [Streptomyces calidiresistens]MQS10393.1 hypothetical protein [Streptomyces alkaliphilus]